MKTPVNPPDGGRMLADARSHWRHEALAPDVFALMLLPVHIAELLQCGYHVYRYKYDGDR
jgi:hypothetical protein